MKIFGIGLQRTGTTSLHEAVKLLGFRSCHFPSVDEAGLTRLKGFDAAFDLPIPLYYQQLDEMFPGSKFIFTDRSLDGWLDSMKTHFEWYPVNHNKFLDSVRQKLYGTLQFDPVILTEAFIRHREKVLNYFSGRNDFLHFNVFLGDGWGRLCPFLSKEKPFGDFPKLNAKLSAKVA